jgi:hypothetical protein
MDRTSRSAVSPTAAAREGLRIDAPVALSLWAGLVHGWVAPDHFVAAALYGWFFVAVAVAQVGYGLLLLRWRHPAVLVAGVAGNVAVLGVYLLTRTRGIPLGPHAGKVEVAGVLDWSAAVAEVAVVLWLCSALEGRVKAAVVNGLLVLGLVAWGTRLAGLL